MSALCDAGKRNLIPEYDQLPRTEEQVLQILTKANLWTSFIDTDEGFSISIRETGGISELSTPFRDQLLQGAMREEKELKELKEFCEESGDSETKSLLERWKAVMKFRLANF